MCLIEKCLSLRFRLKSKLTWFTLEWNFWFEKFPTTKSFFRGRDDGWERRRNGNNEALNQNKKPIFVITHHNDNVNPKHCHPHVYCSMRHGFVRKKKLTTIFYQTYTEWKWKQIENSMCAIEWSIVHVVFNRRHYVVGIVHWIHDTFFIILHEQIVMDCYDVALSKLRLAGWLVGWWRAKRKFVR